MGKSTEQRFLESITVKKDSDCWFWNASTNGSGYGHFSDGGRSIRAHIFSYNLYKGPVPIGMLVCHKCDTPACVNPEHLFLGTHKDNTQDMIAKGRHGYAEVRGEKNGQSKLIEEQVLEARNLYFDEGKSITALARQYGVVPNTLRDAIFGKTWRHLALDPSRKQKIKIKVDHIDVVRAVMAIYYRVSIGDFPPANTMVCEICRENLAKRWYHHKGYIEPYKLDVIAICTDCRSA
jgi:hypothetical protein